MLQPDQTCLEREVSKTAYAVGPGGDIDIIIVELTRRSWRVARMVAP